MVHNSVVVYMFIIIVTEHWMERKITQWVHHEGSIRRPIAQWANTQIRQQKKHKKQDVNVPILE